MKKRFLLLALAGLLLSSCGGGDSGKEGWRTYTKVESETLYAKKVIDQNSDFIMGMDVSSVLAEEASGVKYYDFEGNEQDLMKVLSDNGVNYIRVRVWNDPFDADGHGYGGGNNDVAAAIKIGKRVTANNMKLLVDFHYSDFWADPGKQMPPKAWKNMDIDERANAIYTFTKESLEAMKAENIDVGMVQVGNETNGGSMCGAFNWFQFSQLFAKGSKAVRDVFPEALVACHFTNPEKQGNYIDWAGRMDYYKLDYDVFGSSWYPYWHGTLDNLSDQLTQVAETYNKKVMVLETSYANSYEDTDLGGNTSPNAGDVKPYPISIAGQANHINLLTDKIANHTKNGIGICYWEGAWIAVGDKYEENYAKWQQYGSGWATTYAADFDEEVALYGAGGSQVDNQCFFDKTGHPYESLKMFNLVRFGNEGKIEPDGVSEVTMVKLNTEEFTLPETVDVIYTDNSTKAVPVTWEPFDIEAHKAMGNGKYDINGVAAGYDVVCHLTIMEENFIQNYGFEDWTEKYTDKAVSHDKWDLHVLGPELNAGNTAQATNENPQTGKYNFNFWSSQADNINFELDQEIKALKSGKYKFQFSLMGGGVSDPEAQNIYAYVKINDEVIASQSGLIAGYGNWNDIKIPEFDYTAGDKIVVGAHVQVSTANAWGSLDDFMLNIIL